MDETDNSALTQTLAGALIGGLGGYVDSQNNQSVTATQPLPQTAYGYAGVGQYASAPAASTSAAAGVSSNMMLLLLGAVVVVVLIARK